MGIPRTDANGATAIWTAPQKLESLPLTEMYPHILAVDEKGRFIPTELRHGSETERNFTSACLKNNKDFLDEFADCLVSRGWQKTFGLVITPNPELRPMVEFSFPTGNLLLQSEMVNKPPGVTARTTSWRVGHSPEDRSDETVCFMWSGGHVQIQDTRLSGVRSDVDALQMLQSRNWLVAK